MAWPQAASRDGLPLYALGPLGSNGVSVVPLGPTCQRQAHDSKAMRQRACWGRPGSATDSCDLHTARTGEASCVLGSQQRCPGACL